MNILLVEDDIDLAQTLIDYFELFDIQCDHAGNGILGLQLGQLDDYKTLILDVNVPLLDGFSICQRLRQKGVDTPIIMLTSKAHISDKLTGFESGADDYLVKPFVMEELLARVNALSKRRSGQSHIINIKNLMMNKESKLFFVNEQALNLAPIEYKILEYLTLADEKVISKQQLMEDIWHDEVPKTDALKVHLYKLRKVLANHGCQLTIQTVKGVGLRLQVNHED